MSPTVHGIRPRGAAVAPAMKVDRGGQRSAFLFLFYFIFCVFSCKNSGLFVVYILRSTYHTRSYFFSSDNPRKRARRMTFSQLILFVIDLLPALYCHYYCTHFGKLETSKQHIVYILHVHLFVSSHAGVQQRVESVHWPYMQARTVRRGTSGGRLRYISEHTKNTTKQRSMISYYHICTIFIVRATACLAKAQPPPASRLL